MMSLADLLSEQIRTIFLAEERFARAAPRLIESTSTPAFSRTVEEIAVRATLRIRRLESIAESMSVVVKLRVRREKKAMRRIAIRGSIGISVLD